MRAAGDVDVAPGHKGEAVAGSDLPAVHLDVLPGGDLYSLAGNAAAKVPEVVGTERYELAAGQRAEVMHVATGGDVEGLAAEERSGRGQVAGARHGVEPGHEGRGLRAVGKFHLLRH